MIEETPEIALPDDSHAGWDKLLDAVVRGVPVESVRGVPDESDDEEPERWDGLE